MFLEFIKFIIYSGLIVLVSKYILVKNLRNLGENLNLKPKTVGEVAGIATSIPELITISVSSFSGLIDTSIFNVLSSNIINFLQYITSIVINKNIRKIKNKAIKVDMLMIAFTIIIPILLILLNIEMNKVLIPVFIFLYILFKVISNKTHIKYLKAENEKMKDMILIKEKNRKKEVSKVIKNILFILITGILLFYLGDLLGSVIETLATLFNIPQFIIGLFLGIVTSIPEFITFFEAQRHYNKQDTDTMYGVIEATNNLFTSNILNIFIIQSIGIYIYFL